MFLTLYTAMKTVKYSYFHNISVTLNEHQVLAINEYEIAKLERNQDS